MLLLLVVVMVAVAAVVVSVFMHAKEVILWTRDDMLLAHSIMQPVTNDPRPSAQKYSGVYVCDHPSLPNVFSSLQWRSECSVHIFMRTSGVIEKRCGYILFSVDSFVCFGRMFVADEAWLRRT